MSEQVCVQCGADAMTHGVRDLPYEYRGKKTVVPHVSGWFCDQCGEAYLDDAAAYSQAIDQFATSIDMEEAADLARVRRKLKLTQAEAAKLTGGGPNAFSRYEHGKARPLPAVVNLFKLLDRHPDLLEEIRAA